MSNAKLQLMTAKKSSQAAITIHDQDRRASRVLAARQAHHGALRAPTDGNVQVEAARFARRLHQQFCKNHDKIALDL